MATDTSRSSGAPLSVASLFSSLVYSVVLSAYVLDILGTTTASKTAVTAALLLTAALGGLGVIDIITRRMGYARGEIGLALYCVAFPLLLPWLGELYLAIAPSITDASALSRNGARFGFAMLALAVPGLFLGATLRTHASVSAVLAGGTLGLLAATNIFLPRFGLVATLGIATLIKLTLPFMSRPRKLVATLDDEPAPLPWKAILILAVAAGGVLALLYFRTLLSFALQNPALVPAAAAIVLIPLLLRRAGVALSPSTPRWIAAFAGGGLTYMLVATSAYGVGVLLVLAGGALLGPLSHSPKRWVTPWLAVAVVLAALAIRAGSIVAALAAIALGLVLSLIVRALANIGTVYAAGASGAVVAILLFAAPPAADRAEVRTERQHVVSLFTAERTRALAQDPSAVPDLGFEDVVCASEDASGCLHEDLRSVLFESPERYDVIAVGGAPSRELFQLAADRLRRHGVLIHELALGRLTPRDTFVVLNTADAAFAHVSLWRDERNAFIVASNEPLLIDLDSVRSDWGDASFVSGSPLDFMRHLVVANDDVERFLDAMAELTEASRDEVSTDDRPITLAREHRALDELQNQAIFEHLRSENALGFRGAPTSEEASIARAAFVSGSRGSLPELARAWHESSNASLAASTWLFEGLSGGDANELRENLGHISKLVSATDTITSCERLPRFVSRIDRVPLSVRAHRGASVDATGPDNAVDGTYDPFVGRGWRVHSGGRPVSLDVGLDAPTRIAAVHLVVHAVGESPLRQVRLFGRDPAGAWYPLASDAASECDGVLKFRLSRSSPALDTLRVEVDGDALAVHELWVDAS